MSGLWHPRCVLTLIGWRLRGRRIGHLYKKLMEREYWTAQQWQEYQESLMRSFVRHCYDNVVYYRKQFEKHHLHPNDIKTVGDLRKIPILIKEQVRNNLKELIAENYRNKKLTECHTTGSTGVPLTIYAPLERSEYTMAGLWRIYSAGALVAAGFY